MSDACDAAAAVPDTLQVAWVSRLGDRAGAHAPLPVVRVTELRKLAEARDRDPTAVLQALGLVGNRARGDWKVVVFDVERDWLCRPADAETGTDLAGVPACETGWQKAGRGEKARSYSGCGYLLDTRSGERTLDTWRVEWSTAVSRGFCVLPLERFLDGA